MRPAILIIVILLMCGAAYYYISYGRHYNAIRQPAIVYQPTQQPTQVPPPVAFVTTSAQQAGPTAKPGTCASLPDDIQVFEQYKKQTGQDCGALTDSEQILDEAESKKVLNCLNGALQQGKCNDRKAYIKIQGYEGASESLITTKNCEVRSQQWSTLAPRCGIADESCSTIVNGFPFNVCSSGA